MILSMTGFGKSEGVFEQKKISVEIKSLNSKTFDLNLRLSSRYKEKEMEIRKLLIDSILRGKVDCYITAESLEETPSTKINTDLIPSYMNLLKNLVPDGSGSDVDFLKMVLRLPEISSSKIENLPEEEGGVLIQLIKEAVEKLLVFRKKEGEILAKELEGYLKNIEKYLEDIFPFEEIRLKIIKEKYNTALSEFEQIDQTRFYQEMAYFAEKIDISEEKVRLKQHLNYFKEVMQNEDFSGKKLGFIAQEIGREINTIGSKANQYDIQKIVVKMKDDLEKIKEQLLNIL